MRARSWWIKWWGMASVVMAGWCLLAMRVPPAEWAYWGFFLLLAAGDALFPIAFGLSAISFNLSVFVALFAQYGWLVTVWVAVTASLLGQLKRCCTWRRWLLQLGITVMSLLAGAGAYHACWGVAKRVLLEPQWLALVAFGLTAAGVQAGVRRVLLHPRRPRDGWTSRARLWAAMVNLSTIPVGLLFVTVRPHLGLLGLVLVAVPTASAWQVLRSYAQLLYLNHQLQRLGKVTGQFAAELNYDRTVRAIGDAVRQLVEQDVWGLYVVEKLSGWLEPVIVEKASGQPLSLEELAVWQSASWLLQRHLNRRAPVVLVRDDLGEAMPDKALAALCLVPLVHDGRAREILVVGRAGITTFSRVEKMLLGIIASEAIVAIENALKFRQTEYRSRVDELTGLTNARTFEALLHEAVARAAERGERLSVVLLDLDGFKWLNDTFGHQAGNEMLKRVAQILRENVRRDDVVARLGGEEMVVMLPGVGLDEAAEVAERVRRAIEQQAVITVRTLDRGHPVSVRVTASLGVATYPDVATSARELMRYADRAMYLGAKRRGRNRVAVYGRV